MNAEDGVEPPRQPHRVHPRLVVTLVIVALLVAGVVGALVAGFGRDGDDVTGVGLRPTVDVGHPAGATTAPPAGSPGAGGSGAPGDTGAVGEATTTTSTLVTIAGIDPSAGPGVDGTADAVGAGGAADLRHGAGAADARSPPWPSTTSIRTPSTASTAGAWSAGPATGSR